MTHFLKGDVVRLKSGGPRLVVTGTAPLSEYEQRVFVAWFDAHNQQCDYEFSSSVLDNMKYTGLTPEMIAAFIRFYEPVGLGNEYSAKQTWEVFMNAKAGE